MEQGNSSTEKSTQSMPSNAQELSSAYNEGNYDRTINGKEQYDTANERVTIENPENADALFNGIQNRNDNVDKVFGPDKADSIDPNKPRPKGWTNTADMKDGEKTNYKSSGKEGEHSHDRSDEFAPVTNDKDYNNPANRMNPHAGPISASKGLTDSLTRQDDIQNEIANPERVEIRINDQRNEGFNIHSEFQGADALKRQDEIQQELQHPTPEDLKIDEDTFITPLTKEVFDKQQKEKELDKEIDEDTFITPTKSEEDKLTDEIDEASYLPEEKDSTDKNNQDNQEPPIRINPQGYNGESPDISDGPLLNQNYPQDETEKKPPISGMFDNEYDRARYEDAVRRAGEGDEKVFGELDKMLNDEIWEDLNDAQLREISETLELKETYENNNENTTEDSEKEANLENQLALANEFAGELSPLESADFRESTKGLKGYLATVKIAFKKSGGWKRVLNSIGSSALGAGAIGALGATAGAPVVGAVVGIGMAASGVGTMIQVRKQMKEQGYTFKEAIKDKEFIKGALLSGSTKIGMGFLKSANPVMGILAPIAGIGIEVGFVAIKEHNLTKQHNELVTSMLAEYSTREYYKLSDNDYIITRPDGNTTLQVSRILEDAVDQDIYTGQRDTAIKVAFNTLQYLNNRMELGMDTFEIRGKNGNQDVVHNIMDSNFNVEQINLRSLNQEDMQRLLSTIGETWEQVPDENKFTAAQNIVASYAKIETQDVEAIFEDRTRKYLDNIKNVTAFRSGMAAVNGLTAVFSGSMGALNAGQEMFGENDRPEGKVSYNPHQRTETETPTTTSIETETPKSNPFITTVEANEAGASLWTESEDIIAQLNEAGANIDDRFLAELTMNLGPDGAAPQNELRTVGLGLIDSDPSFGPAGGAVNTGDVYDFSKVDSVMELLESHNSGKSVFDILNDVNNPVPQPTPTIPTPVPEFVSPITETPIPVGDGQGWLEKITNGINSNPANGWSALGTALGFAGLFVGNERPGAYREEINVTITPSNPTPQTPKNGDDDSNRTTGGVTLPTGSAKNNNRKTREERIREAKERIRLADKRIRDYYNTIGSDFDPNFSKKREDESVKDWAKRILNREKEVLSPTPNQDLQTTAQTFQDGRIPLTPELEIKIVETRYNLNYNDLGKTIQDKIISGGASLTEEEKEIIIKKFQNKETGKWDDYTNLMRIYHPDQTTTGDEEISKRIATINRIIEESV